MPGESKDPTALPLAGQCGFNPDPEFIFGGEDTKVGHIMSLYKLMCNNVAHVSLESSRIAFCSGQRQGKDTTGVNGLSKYQLEL